MLVEGDVVLGGFWVVLAGWQGGEEGPEVGGSAGAGVPGSCWQNNFSGLYAGFYGGRLAWTPGHGARRDNYT